MNRWRFIPLLVLVAFVAAVAWRLSHPPDTKIASRMVGKALPALVLPPAIPGQEGLRFQDSFNGPRLINFFASWCVPCIAESPMLMELKRQGVPIEGIAVRDRPEAVAAFLAQHGNPYDGIGADRDSRVQLALGSAGVPETFLIDAYGTVRRQHIGPIEAGDVAALRREWEALQK